MGKDPDNQKINVLVVEDDEERFVLTSSLLDEIEGVHSEPNGSNRRRCVERWAESFDIAVDTVGRQGGFSGAAGVTAGTYGSDTVTSLSGREPRGNGN